MADLHKIKPYEGRTQSFINVDQLAYVATNIDGRMIAVFSGGAELDITGIGELDEVFRDLSGRNQVAP